MNVHRQIWQSAGKDWYAFHVVGMLVSDKQRRDRPEVVATEEGGDSPQRNSAIDQNGCAV